MNNMNDNRSYSGLVEKYIGTAYDKVAAVANSLAELFTIHYWIEKGYLQKILALGDEIVLAAAMIDYQGLWDAKTLYKQGQSVSYNDVLWLSNIDHSGSAPSTNNTNWTLLSAVDIKTVDTLADIPVGSSGIDTVIVRGYHYPGDGGGGIFHYDITKDRSFSNGGTIIDATGTYIGLGCWIREYVGPISVKWFGAVGDGIETAGHFSGTDDTDAIERMFDLIQYPEDSMYSAIRQMNGRQPQFYFPVGRYHVTRPISVFRANKYLAYMDIKMDSGAVIQAHGLANDEFALTFKNLRNCTFENLRILAEKCSGLNIVGSRDGKYEHLRVGATGKYSLRLGGVIFSNTFINTGLNQSMAYSGAEFAFYMDGETIDPDTDNVPTIAGVGAPINLFSGFFVAGAKKLITIVAAGNYIEQSWQMGNIRFDTVELEGATTYLLDVQGVTKTLIFSNVWTEAGPDSVPGIRFKDCGHVTLKQWTVKHEEMYFENINSLTIDNVSRGATPEFYGTIANLIISNCQFESNTDGFLGNRNNNVNAIPDKAIFDSVNAQNIVVLKGRNSGVVPTDPINAYDKSNRKITLRIHNSQFSVVGGTRLPKAYFDYMVYSYVSKDGSVKEQKLVGQYDCNAVKYVSDSNDYAVTQLEIFHEIRDYQSNFKVIAGLVWPMFNTFSGYDTGIPGNILTYPRVLGDETLHINCKVRSDPSLDGIISPLGLQTSLVTGVMATGVKDNMRLTLDMQHITKSLGNMHEQDIVIMSCWLEATPETIDGKDHYIQHAGVLINHGAYGQVMYCVEKEGRRYLISYVRTKIRKPDGSHPGSERYPQLTVNNLAGGHYQNGDKLVFGGVLIYKGSDIRFL